MRRIVFSTLVFLLAASAAQADHIHDCNQVRDLDRQLRGCTAYIHAAEGEAPNRAAAYLNRANIQARRGQYVKAFAAYNAALTLDPTNPLIPYDLGNAYLDSGQAERAEEAFTRAISLDNTFALAYFNRGIARERLGDTPGADEDFRRTLELDPGADHALEGLGRLRTQ
jgi:tetratricopeptide (TPR) repeat protein